MLDDIVRPLTPCRTGLLASELRAELLVELFLGLQNCQSFHLCPNLKLRILDNNRNDLDGSLAK